MKNKTLNERLMIDGYRNGKMFKVIFLNNENGVMKFEIFEKNKISICIKQSQNKFTGHCSCAVFNDDGICIHIPTILHEIRNKKLLPHVPWMPEFTSVFDLNEFYQHEFLNLLISQSKAKTEEIILFKEPEKSLFDIIYYEYVHPLYSPKKNPVIIFHTANYLKNGNPGSPKIKKFKYKDLGIIDNPDDFDIFKKLLPSTFNSKQREYSYSNSQEVFDSSEIFPDMGPILLQIIKTGRAFIQNKTYTDKKSQNLFINFISTSTIDIKINVNTLMKNLKLGFFIDDQEINIEELFFIFTQSNLILIKDKAYRINNYLPRDLINYLLQNENITLTESEFNIVKNEILSSLDHKVVGGDLFLLPVNKLNVPYIVHLKLPIQSNTIQACIRQERIKTEPPFYHLSIQNDQHFSTYHQLINTELNQSIDENGMFFIPEDRLQTFLEKANEIDLKIVADKAVIKPLSHFHISVTHNMNWFEIKGSAEFDGVEISLPEILKKINNKDDFIEFKNGEKAYLPKKWIDKANRLNDVAEFIDGKYVVHQSRALQLESLEIENIDLNQFLFRIKNFKSLPEVKVHKRFKGTLRDYQIFGLKWMSFLRNLSLGGCLADDMGLGKTVQVAANLLQRKYEKDANGLKSIIICPKSLVFNWRNELARFTPDLKVETIESGNFKLDAIEADIIITTYGILQRSCELFQKHLFDYAILDEAQVIKNPRSLTAKAAFTLNANHRLALTGTPVENHIGDLYSIFNFLMPGVYKKAALNPDHQNRAKAQGLKPFILRRTKSQVLNDLPDKIEQIIYCTQGAEEKKHYEKLKEFVSSKISKEADKTDLKKSSLLVLEALTRLRQAACHPGLLNSELQDIESGKLSQLSPMLNEILDEGHKVVIFSQFTSLLKLTRLKLNFTDENSCYLDGKSTNRESIVNDFQTSKLKNVFFISLKAGGTGLNLTEASYCFLMDPWWNPAVEDQAIARLHRMGQKKSVNVYRLISKNTVEEKVIKLQEIKSKIVKDVIADDGEGFIRNLKSSDLQFLLN